MTAVDLPLQFAQRAYLRYREQHNEEAMRLVDAALRLEPELAGALHLKGLLALRAGDYATGWPLFEYRIGTENARSMGMDRYRQRRWDGQPRPGRLLLWAEQGLGDTIMMLRLLPRVRELCPDLELEVQPELVRLCEENDLAPLVSPVGAGTGRFDAQCSLMSLPLVLGYRPLGLGVPYLHAQRRSDLLPIVPRVGLCWEGNRAAPDGATRSISFGQLEELAAEFDLLSLQQESLRGIGVADVAGTAAVLDQLDLVVTIDTMMAHLAGALGLPTWLLLRVNADWRWGTHATRTPWYPTMRLFRQRETNQWGPVLAEVQTALRQRPPREQAA